MPNFYGGNANLEAIALLRYTNHTVGTQRDGAVTVAEESISFPASPARRRAKIPLQMEYGWMNDRLHYMQLDPVHRKYHHQMTFSMVYAYSENFTPLPRKGYCIGVLHGGRWHEVLNTDSTYYNGSNSGNQGEIHSEPIPWHYHSYSLSLTLPPLANLFCCGRGNDGDDGGVS